jgi:hypothetical protein
LTKLCFVWASETNRGGGWIRKCISTARVSVLVNGSPTTEFPIKKGLRQGDPLSSFLFNITVEGLSKMIGKGCDLDLVEGIHLGFDNLRISHLQFADDTLIFSFKSLSSI